MSGTEGDPVTGTAAPAPAIAPDPAEYDSERAAAARRRGLPGPYIPGGRDPDQAATEREERRWVRLLLLMIVVVVASGFVLGFLAAALGFDFLVGTPS